MTRAPRPLARAVVAAGRLARRPRVLALAGLALALALVVALLRAGGAEAVRAQVSLAGLRPHREHILFAARESRLDPYLLAALVRAESSGRTGAVSSKGALGLVQLMPATAAERARVLGLPEPTREDLLTDARLNLRLGAAYLAWLLERAGGDLERALVAYNTGPTRLARWIAEAGSYGAWSAERRAAGNSDVLAFADRVRRYRDELRETGFLDGEPARR